MNPVYEKLERCYKSVRKRTDFVPRVALVLGSGLGDYAEEIQIEKILPYEEIEGFPVSTVPGHKGRFIFGYVGPVPVVIMQGRVHYYEGYAMTDVVLPVRLMKLLGAEILFLTNAAGGVNFDFHPGDFMMITDQIASFVPSPLIGANVEELGERFSDMSQIYDKELQNLLEETAGDLGIALQKVYDFMWTEFCDWYIELVKPVFFSDDDKAKGVVYNVLYTVLTTGLKLLHPVMQFITEEIYTT